MLWYNPDTGHLFVRSADNLSWIPIAGLPSAEFGPNPPTEDRGEHPIEEGDLWWDSDIAALFVAARDVTDQMVWVVALPADRGAVPDTQLPFRFPFSVDGRIETNPTTGIRYIYHAAKNQWIDIPTTGNNIFYQEDAPTLENANLGIGDLWIKESTKQVYVFDGISWKDVRARPTVYQSDTRPADTTISNGELWWDSSDEELTLYIYYNGDWIPAAPPVSTEGIETSITNIEEELDNVYSQVNATKLDVFQTASDLNFAVEETKKDQQRQDERLDALENNSGGDDFLPTAGGELKGTLQINGSMDNKIDPLLCRADGYYMTFGVTKTGEVLAGSAPALPFMAVDNWHVVTKGYLDSRLPDEGLFHETWWTFRASADRSDCEKGEFCADDGDFFMSDKNQDNHTWGPNIAGGRNTQMFVTIYSSEGKLCHTYEVNKIHFHEKYTKKYITEFDWTWSHVSNALVDGAKYKIVVPGFLT